VGHVRLSWSENIRRTRRSCLSASTLSSISRPLVIFTPLRAGLSVSFAIAGKQYIAITTARVIAPEIHHPGNDNALYVFALPDDPRP
jgi:hypothetical protein